MSRVSRKPIGHSAAAWFYGPQGFGSTRVSFPSPEAIRKADHAMALSDAGRCGFCAGTLNEDERCLQCFPTQASE